MTDYPATPQHDKLKPKQDTAQTIGGFLDWLLNESPYYIAEFDPSDSYLGIAHKPIEEWISRYLGIDYKAYMEEKAAVLRWVQAPRDDGTAYLERVTEDRQLTADDHRLIRGLLEEK